MNTPPPITEKPSIIQRTIAKLKTLRLQLLGPSHDEAERDRIQLRTLAGSFFAFGILGSLISCISIPNLVAVLFFVILPMQTGSGVVVSDRGVILLSFGFFTFLILLVLMERLCFFVYQSISQRKRLRFVGLISKAFCLLFPFGTVLGLCSLHILARERVRTQFTE